MHRLLVCSLHIRSTLFIFVALVYTMVCMEKKQHPMQTAPKQFCENVTIGFTKEFFVLGLQNGTQGTAHVLTPGHMKRLGGYIAHQIREYEQKHGTIDTPEWSPDIKSPVVLDKEK